MGWKETIENNVILFLVGVAIAAFSAGFAVRGFFIEHTKKTPIKDNEGMKLIPKDCYYPSISHLRSKFGISELSEDWYNKYNEEDKNVDYVPLGSIPSGYYVYAEYSIIDPLGEFHVVRKPPERSYSYYIEIHVREEEKSRRPYIVGYTNPDSAVQLKKTKHVIEITLTNDPTYYDEHTAAVAIPVGKIDYIRRAGNDMTRQFVVSVLP